ncbi:hypothetical protein BV25DRAFT_113979 [Artomyces pyxidatus]|uniref:Uncharacterized protein n=1 Tax=Artomyces pyxidatus TaxID=48021 RepID=A0ACB8TLA2_9AGAM|nr:hypothetical protein BV25DRAFT_113979 [Artomyces pyxidatus]
MVTATKSGETEASEPITRACARGLSQSPIKLRDRSDARFPTFVLLPPPCSPVLFGLPGSAPGPFFSSLRLLSFIQQAEASRHSSIFTFKMRFSTASSLLALATPLLVSALPMRRATDPNTLLVLQFANVLEQLETQFYQQALQKFQASDFTAAGFTSAQLPVEQFTAIASDESTHQTILQETIQSFGASPITTCKFDFSSVLSDVPTMASAARLVENVGVGAYLGAAHLVEDPVILTAAATIVTVEARHQTVLNILNGGTAIPQAFDLPLLPQEVLAIAGGFISGCDLGITANPALTVTNSGPIQVGTSLSFSSSAINGSTSGLFCQMLAGGLPFSISLPFNACVVPSGITGPVAIFITSDDQPLNNNARDQNVNTIIAGPTMAFLDNKPEVIGSLVRSSGNGVVTSTATISPGAASSIIASVSSATSSATPSPSSSSNNNAAVVSSSPGVIVNGWSMVPVPT